MAVDRPVLIYGNGAVARLVHSYVRRETEIVGFTVDDAVMNGATTFCGRPLHPFSDIEARCPPSSCRMLIAVGYRDMNRLRLRKHAEAKAKGYAFASYVHAGLFRHDDVSMGENVIVLEQSSIHPGCTLGDCVFIASNVNLGHDCTVGSGAWINSGVSLGGGCKIGAGVLFGVNACAAHGLTIGEHALIGANALAASDVAPGASILPQAGAPGRFKAGLMLRVAGGAG
ncbi:MAG: acetyltransferase [Hyphomonadaceae bacterium]|nr:acetyltransferase [Hyphomonadaceae bacterium]